MDCSLSKADLHQLVLEMGAFSKIMGGKAMDRRPKFPYKCKNGASCPFQVCGNCWFVHDGDAISTVNQQAVKASSMPKETQHSSELLLNKLTGITTEFEKKLVNLSQSIDLRLAAFESKLEAMADAILKNEVDVQELQEEQVVIRKPEEISQNSSQLKVEIAKELGETFQLGIAKSFEEFGKLMDARFSHIESKIYQHDGGTT